MMHTSLVKYYETLHAFKDHKYSIDEVENMIPFERDIFIAFINDDMKKSSHPTQDQFEAPID